MATEAKKIEYGGARKYFKYYKMLYEYALLIYEIVCV